MSGTSSSRDAVTSMTLTEALHAYRTTPNGELSPAASQLLEETRERVWQSIQKDESYSMTAQEFSVLNALPGPHKDDARYTKAVSRFWKVSHEGPSPSQADRPNGGRPSDGAPSSSTAKR